MFPLLAFFLTMFRRHRYRSDSGSRRTRGVKYCRRDPLLSSLDVGGLKWTWKISSEMHGVAHLQPVAIVLQFVDPTGPGWGLLGDDWLTPMNESGGRV